MLPCHECHTAGHVSCAECDQLGVVREASHFGEQGDRTCHQCNGRKRTRCHACGGIGWLGADNVFALPVDYRATDVEEDPPVVCCDGGRLASAAIERLVSGDW
jgi:hypothetical protein